MPSVRKDTDTRIDEPDDEADSAPLASAERPGVSHRSTDTTERQSHQSTSDDPEIDERRRAVVGGLAAMTGLSGFRIPDLSSGIAFREVSATPHTVATFEALVDAAVPRTPALADQRGPEHEPGGLDVDLEAYLVWSLNHLLPFQTPVDLAEQVAQLLDQGAFLLVERGENEDPPTVEQFPNAGLFGRLSRQDRFRAIQLLEENEVTILTLVNILVHFGYYSEWSGYEDNTGPPTDRTFTGEVQSWEQTKFPGPAVGYRDFRGYLVEEFEESEFEDEGENQDEDEDDQHGSEDEGEDESDDEDDQNGFEDEEESS